MSFNKLTDAQAERLAMLAEEAGEVVQAVTKILRHGYMSSYDNGETNQAALERELGDMAAVLRLMMLRGDIPPYDINTHAQVERAVARKLRYSHHQGAL